MVEPHSSNFRVITTNFLCVRIFRKITVYHCKQTRCSFYSCKLSKQTNAFQIMIILLTGSLSFPCSIISLMTWVWMISSASLFWNTFKCISFDEVCHFVYSKEFGDMCLILLHWLLRPPSITILMSELYLPHQETSFLHLQIDMWSFCT